MPEPSLFTNSSQQNAFDRGISFILTQISQDKIPLKAGQVYKNYECGKDTSHPMINHATGSIDNVGYYTDLEMIAILLDVYNNQTTAPFVHAVDNAGNITLHNDLLVNIVGSTPITPSQFLGVYLPLYKAHDLHKGFHATDPNYNIGMPIPGINVTWGYQNSSQLNRWEGLHQGNWFSNVKDTNRPLAHNNTDYIFNDAARWHPANSISGNTSRYSQLVDFYQPNGQTLKFQGFNAFDTNSGYIVGLDPKLQASQIQSGLININQLHVNDIEEKAVIGFTFEYYQTEFIFWIYKGEAFLEATNTAFNGIRRRISVSTSGGMGLWQIV